MRGKRINSDNYTLADFVQLDDLNLFAKAEPFLSYIEDMYMKHLNPLLNKIVPKAFDMMTPQDRTGSKRVFKTNQQKSEKK